MRTVTTSEESFKRRWQRFAPLVLFSVAIFLSSSTVVTPKAFVKSVSTYSPIPITEASFGEFWENWWWIFVKGWHATEFAIVFLLLRHLLTAARTRFAFWLTVLLAAGDELHQLSVPLRGSRVSDWLIDALGVTLCLGFLALRHRPWSRGRKGMALLLGGLTGTLLLRTLALHPFP